MANWFQNSDLFVFAIFTWKGSRIVLLQLMQEDNSVSPIAHYLFTIMNTQKKDTLRFCFPGLLGIHRNPKWKEFSKSRESFLKKVPICTLTDLNTGFGGPWNKLQIILVNGTFIMPQKKFFGQTIFWISCTGSKVPFWQNEKYS